ncbi:lactonase family protein [Streptococcus loxodontisalivarius]|uniref:6-phosphogluconolactonase n=1 Tax=Streptococcus loxodontisalivarius TaxID=1349415 RepID=A0ABS2PRK7_9STRE|nr:lactonase family protein [Streptococcus loxodontisalivarius]MBM7642657.1 6-phosphogluconolactonase [Streptococcus loxodontisalivarius]
MTQTLYFGTYTKGQSQGIYQANFDEKTAEISDLKLFVEEGSPTYLAFSDEAIFSISNQEGKGGIAAYDLNGQLIDRHLEAGPAPCHISYDPGRQLIYTANYHTAQIKVYYLDDNHKLQLSDYQELTGSGPHPNQNQAHPHFVGLTPDHYLLVCDLGSDRLFSYKLVDGKLQQMTSFQTKSGSGPRHLVFHPSHKLAYLVNELDSTVDVLIYNGCGYFEHETKISTLPADFKGNNAAAAIKMSQDQRFLYVSNRGHNSIACFKIEIDSGISLVDITPSHGQIPRDICLSPKQDHLLACHQESNHLSVFKRDSETGLLTFISNQIQVPEAVFIDFKQNTF